MDHKMCSYVDKRTDQATQLLARLKFFWNVLSDGYADRRMSAPRRSDRAIANGRDLLDGRSEPPAIVTGGERNWYPGAKCAHRAAFGLKITLVPDHHMVLARCQPRERESFTFVARDRERDEEPGGGSHG
jgi:hypothetical protein